jgi:vancomycin resistance protein YoaR
VKKSLSKVNFSPPRIAALLAGAAIGVLLLLTAFEAIHFNKIYSGVSVAGVPVGRQSIPQAAQNIRRRLSASASARLTFVHDKQTLDVSLKEIQFRYDASASARKAFWVGRRQSFWSNLKTRLTLVKEGLDLDPEYVFNTDKLFIELHALVDRPPLPTRITLDAGAVDISQGRSGQVLDEKQLKKDLHRRLAKGEFEPVITLPVTEIPAAIDADKTQKAKRLLTALLKQPLVLNANGERFDLLAQDILTFLQPIESSGSASLAANNIFAPVPSSKASPPRRLISPIEVSRFLSEKIAPFVDQTARDAAFRIENGRVSVFTPSRVGRRLETGRAAALIAARLERLASAPKMEEAAPAIIDLPVSFTQPKIPTSAVNNLGIETLLGRGVSHFRGSIANRIDNIELTASRFRGVLVPPGETASFNKILGEVSRRTGFKPAYVIKQGRTVLDDGGGVCQASTTLFRAAMDAGLPIVERTAHAYRVAYYEQGFDPGLDATVYAPLVDLKFKNDTPGYLLIQASLDRAASTLVYEIYGTDDGRKSFISKPRVTNVQPPPEPLYQDDPTLPKGKIKQVDWAAWGAKVTFTYRVTRGQETLFEKTYVSNYRPWQAVYLKGIKEG